MLLGVYCVGLGRTGTGGRAPHFQMVANPVAAINHRSLLSGEILSPPIFLNPRNPGREGPQTGIAISALLVVSSLAL